LVSDQLLEEAGVLGDVSVHEYPLYFVPLAEDLLSLELDHAFGDLYLVRFSIIIYLLESHSFAEKRSNLNIYSGKGSYDLSAETWPISAYPR
jgi:hypothetical protein